MDTFLAQSPTHSKDRLCCCVLPTRGCRQCAPITPGLNSRFLQDQRMKLRMFGGQMSQPDNNGLPKEAQMHFPTIHTHMWHHVTVCHSFMFMLAIFLPQRSAWTNTKMFMSPTRHHFSGWSQHSEEDGVFAVTSEFYLIRLISRESVHVLSQTTVVNVSHYVMFFLTHSQLLIDVLWIYCKLMGIFIQNVPQIWICLITH